MSIIDIRKAFMNACQGVLSLSECTLHYVKGPNGEPEHQRLRFVCAHGPSQRRFVINPHPELDQYRNGGDIEHLEIPPTPPLGDLYETTRLAVMTVLKAVGEPKAFKDAPPPPGAYLG
jgi:hypothetical protein